MLPYRTRHVKACSQLMTTYIVSDSFLQTRKKKDKRITSKDTFFLSSFLSHLVILTQSHELYRHLSVIINDIKNKTGQDHESKQKITVVRLVTSGKKKTEL